MSLIRKASCLATLASLAVFPFPAAGQEMASPTDYRLELLVRGAYLAATGYAQTHGNYFAQDGDTGELLGVLRSRVAIPVELANGMEPEMLSTCGSEGGTMRLAINVFGDGVALAAADTERVVVYVYEPRQSASVLVTPPKNCTSH